MSEIEKLELLKEKIAKSNKYVLYIDYFDLLDLFNIIENQQKEIEEKTTIMAGAEKVKQLEKGNRSLMESRIKWKNRYYKEKAKNKEYISKDKIKEKLNQINNEYNILLSNKSLSLERQNMNAQRHEAMRVVLEELLEEE